MNPILGFQLMVITTNCGNGAQYSPGISGSASLHRPEPALMWRIIATESRRLSLHRIALCLVLVIACSACVDGNLQLQDSPPPDAAHSSQNSLDWPGVYSGIVPCADCEGISTRLSLAADGTYLLQRQYVGRSEAVFASKGSFTWSADGSRIVLNGEDAPNQYQVGENLLFQLDMEGRRIEGALASLYVLQRVADGGPAGQP